jgi:Sigma-70, region 4
MNLHFKSQTDTHKADDYAMSEDFYRLCKEDAEGLYQLSYMLMADHEKAERCFIGGLEDSVNGNSVYKQWARSWARRRIIQCAIRTLAPGLQHADDELNVEAESEENPALAAILHLPAFERFVFVMSTLEGYSDQECSILLGCSRGEVITARTQALRRLSKLDADHVLPFADAALHPVTKTQTL